MVRSVLGALAVAWLLAPGVAVAQSDPLHNVREVKLTMPEPGEAGKSCGLSRQLLETAFFEPLAERGLRVVASGTGYRLFLRATTIAYLEESCVSYVEAQLLLATRYQDSANQQEQSGNVQLWADGGLFASDSREHGATVEREMRGLGRKLAARWDAAN
jgi:hypothetical protein